MKEFRWYVDKINNRIKQALRSPLIVEIENRLIAKGIEIPDGTTDHPFEMKGSTPVWKDILYPFIGQRIDTSGGRMTYNYAEKGVQWANNTQFTDQDGIHFACQFNHFIKLTNAEPHIHWIQNQNQTPNWVMTWRKYRNGQVAGAWTNVAYSSNVFTYSAGTIMQMTEFPSIDISDFNVSDFIDVRITRDTGNTSGLFAGADPYVGTVIGKEFDFHVEKFILGSRTEYAQ